jgi:membrane protease YdiL (CAAX protease family)
MPDLNPAALRDVPWSWRDVLLGLAAVIGVALALYLFLDLLVLTRDASAPTWLRILLSGLIQCCMFAYPLWVVRRRGLRTGLPRVRSVPVESLLALLAVGVVMSVAIVVVVVVVLIFGEDVVASSPFERIAGSQDRRDWLVLIFLAIGVAPIAEEVFFRGMLYNALRRRWPLAVAILAQAVVFGLFHPFGLVQRGLIVMVGLALALLYEWRKTLLAPILMHTWFNSIGLMLLFVSTTLAANAPVMGVRSASHEHGCLVEEVLPDSGAEEAALRAGDILTAIDGTPTKSPESLIRLIRRKRAGDSVSVDYLRDGKTQRVSVVLKARPK